MKSKLYSLSIFIFLLFISVSVFSSPRVNYSDLAELSERNPDILSESRGLAMNNSLPLTILLPGNIKIEALGVENGKVVYGVIKNFLHPFRDAETMFYEDILASFDLSSAKMYMGNQTIIDNSDGAFSHQLVERGAGPFLIVIDSGFDRLTLIDYSTGDLVDTAFFPSGTVNFGTPKSALQTNYHTILVADQITDGVFEYDTTGSFIRLFAPSTGINPAILDNIRGMAYRNNGNLLVTVASGGSSNTIQQFDTSGASLGTFITGNISSPFDIGMRTGDMIITCSSGSTKIFKYDLNGTLIAPIAGTFSFLQQIYVNSDGSFAVSSFSSTTAGLVLYDSAGNQGVTLTGVTGNRGVYRLGNGNYAVTNSAGLHEIDDTTGSLIRSIYAGGSFQYISYYDPNMLVGVHNNTGTVPSQYKLYTNYPNPFNPSTKIKFAIPNSGITKVAVYNSLGKEVATLVNRFHTAGEYEYNFDASGLSSGVYFYTLTSGDFRETKKMLLLK